MGEPRLCDIAPDIASKTRRSNSLKSQKQQGFDWKEEAPGPGAAYGDDAHGSVFKARSSNSLKSPKHQALDWRYSPLPTSEEAPGAGAPLGEDVAFKSFRSNSLKSSKVQGFDWRYTPLPASEGAQGAGAPLGDDVREIAISEDCARYYNFSAMRAEQRRHSIGAFAMRERTVSVASSTRSCKDGVGDQGKIPEFDDHSLRHGSYPRKRCSRCTRGKSILFYVLCVLSQICIL